MIDRGQLGEAGAQSRVEIVMKDDGTMTGGVYGRNGWVDYRQGKWRLDGETVLVEYLLGSGSAFPVSWKLRRNGESLAGEGYRPTDAGRFSVDIKRAK